MRLFGKVFVVGATAGCELLAWLVTGQSVFVSGRLTWIGILAGSAVFGLALEGTLQYGLDAWRYVNAPGRRLHGWTIPAWALFGVIMQDTYAVAAHWLPVVLAVPLTAWTQGFVFEATNLSRPMWRYHDRYRKAFVLAGGWIGLALLFTFGLNGFLAGMRTLWIWVNG